MILCINKKYYHKILQCECTAIGYNRGNGTVILETPFGRVHSYTHDIEEVLKHNEVQ